MRDRVRKLLDTIDSQQGELRKAAELVLDAVDGGGIVHAAGAGHSLAMVCETFYRAGGLAADTHRHLPPRRRQHRSEHASARSPSARW